MEIVIQRQELGCLSHRLIFIIVQALWVMRLSSHHCHGQQKVLVGVILLTPPELTLILMD